MANVLCYGTAQFNRQAATDECSTAYRIVISNVLKKVSFSGNKTDIPDKTQSSKYKSSFLLRLTVWKEEEWIPASHKINSRSVHLEGNRLTLNPTITHAHKYCTQMGEVAIVESLQSHSMRKILGQWRLIVLVYITPYSIHQGAATPTAPRQQTCVIHYSLNSVK